MMRKLFAGMVAVCLSAQSLYGVSGSVVRVSGLTRNSKLETRNAVGCFAMQVLQEPVLSMRRHEISIPTEIQIINWVREVAALNDPEVSSDGMRLKAVRLIDRFLEEARPESLYFLDKRLGLASKAILALRREAGNHAASVGLNSAYEHLKHHVKALWAKHHTDPKKEAHLKELWLKLFRLYGGIVKAAGHAMDPAVTVILGPHHAFAIRVGLSEWNPAIEEWAKGFEIHLDRKLPTESLQGIWSVIFHTRLREPRGRQTPGEGGLRRTWLWGIIRGPLEALFGPAIVVAMASSLFTTGIGNGYGDGEQHFPYPYPDMPFPQSSFRSQALAESGISAQNSTSVSGVVKSVEETAELFRQKIPQDKPKESVELERAILRITFPSDIWKRLRVGLVNESIRCAEDIEPILKEFGWSSQLINLRIEQVALAMAEEMEQQRTPAIILPKKRGPSLQNGTKGRSDQLEDAPYEPDFEWRLEGETLSHPTKHSLKPGDIVRDTNDLAKKGKITKVLWNTILGPGAAVLWDSPAGVILRGPSFDRLEWVSDPEPEEKVPDPREELEEPESVYEQRIFATTKPPTPLAPAYHWLTLDQIRQIIRTAIQSVGIQFHPQSIESEGQLRTDVGRLLHHARMEHLRHFYENKITQSWHELLQEEGVPPERFQKRSFSTRSLMTDA